jgi:hypothetical protein
LKGFPVVETVTAYEVRQQKDQELRQNDEFWTTKLRDLEARVSVERGVTVIIGFEVNLEESLVLSVFFF